MWDALLLVLFGKTADDLQGTLHRPTSWADPLRGQGLACFLLAVVCYLRTSAGIGGFRVLLSAIIKVGGLAIDLQPWRTVSTRLEQ